LTHDPSAKGVRAALAEVKRLATTVTASERAISAFWLANVPYLPDYETAYALMA
jgi:hypothetical protein